MTLDEIRALDHRWFRKYSSQLGRWSTADPAGLMAVSLDAPQSLNRYSYVSNMPLSYVDPTGLGSCTGAERRDGDCGHQVNDAVGSDCELWDPSCATTCIVNGFASSCGWTQSLIQQGLAARCPENNCANVWLTSGPGGSDILRQWNPPDYWDTLGPDTIHLAIGYWSLYELVGDPLLRYILLRGDGQVPMPAKIRATPKLTFEPPSWHGFIHKFLPCYAGQLTYNFVGNDERAFFTAGSVALSIKKPLLGGVLLVTWTAVNAFDAGSGCAFMSRAVYQ